MYGVGMETRKALEIIIVRARMEARRALQTDAWEAILRIAGGYVDFELDDLVALETRAQAEFDRANAEAKERAGANTDFHTLFRGQSGISPT